MGLKDIKKNWQKRRAIRKFRNRNITKAKFLYYYFILSGIYMFSYAIFSILLNRPFLFTWLPLALLLVAGFFIVVKRNWKLVWLYVSDMEQGQLLMRLNEHSHFSQEHKLQLIQWVYPRRNRIRIEKMVRIERILELSNKVMEGEELTRKEKKELKRKVVRCPQQLKDGINEAILVSNLIYAHENIQILDDELRNAMDLTDEHIQAFDLQTEINRCIKNDKDKKISKLTEIGMNKLNKEREEDKND